MQIWKHKKSGEQYIRVHDAVYYNPFGGFHLPLNFVVFFPVNEKTALVLETERFLEQYECISLK